MFDTRIKLGVQVHHDIREVMVNDFLKELEKPGLIIRIMKFLMNICRI